MGLAYIFIDPKAVFGSEPGIPAKRRRRNSRITIDQSLPLHTQYLPGP